MLYLFGNRSRSLGTVAHELSDLRRWVSWVRTSSSGDRASAEAPERPLKLSKRCRQWTLKNSLQDLPTGSHHALRAPRPRLTCCAAQCNAPRVLACSKLCRGGLFNKALSAGRGSVARWENATALRAGLSAATDSEPDRSRRNPGLEAIAAMPTSVVTEIMTLAVSE